MSEGEIIRDCRDCKHCRVMRPSDRREDVCRLVPVVGFFCVTERLLALTGCGPEGLNFEPASPRPWWAFWRKK